GGRPGWAGPSSWPSWTAGPCSPTCSVPWRARRWTGWWGRSGGAPGRARAGGAGGGAEPLVVKGWAAGMGHVLAATLAQAGDDWAAVVVLLGAPPPVAGRAGGRGVAARG